MLDLDKFCNAYLTLLGKCLNSPNKTQNQSSKSVECVVRQTAKLTKFQVLQLALSARLCDDATLVRTQYTSLLANTSKPTQTKPTISTTHYATPYPMKGFRSKKAIRLTRDIYPMFSETSRISIATKMLKRLNDEEDNIRKKQHQCWSTAG